jgi:RHS repeat-associated protein
LVARSGCAAFGCAGGCRDPAIGLVYLRARWLDAATGLFLSVDPAESLGGDAYGYAAGNPLQLVDPLGLLPGWMEDALKTASDFVYGVADELTMGLASAVVDGLGVETDWLDSCSSAFKAGQTAAVVGGLVIGLVTTGGAAAALAVAEMVAKQGLKNTLKAAAKTAGKKAAGVAARAMKTLRTQADNLGQKAKRHWAEVKKFAGGDTGSIRIPGGGKNEPHRIYSSRVLQRMSEEPGPFHNFPASFDRLIFSQGARTVERGFFRQPKALLSNDSVQYSLRGSVNGYQGSYEIFARPSTSGRTEVIMHRFFRRD